MNHMAKMAPSRRYLARYWAWRYEGMPNAECCSWPVWVGAIMAPVISLVFNAEVYRFTINFVNYVENDELHYTKYRSDFMVIMGYIVIVTCILKSLIDLGLLIAIVRRLSSTMVVLMLLYVICSLFQSVCATYLAARGSSVMTFVALWNFLFIYFLDIMEIFRCEMNNPPKRSDVENPPDQTESN